MKIKISELKKLTQKVIESYGYNKEETRAIKNVLMYAQLRGNNQGVVKLIGAGIPKREGGKTSSIVKETPVSALVDGNKTHAIVVMDYITDLAKKKAKKSGVGIVGNFNTSESTGAIGYYVNKIAEEGLIGLAFSAAPFQSTAAYGSTEALFCTNPLAYGIPTEEDPVVLDMSTSAMAYYGLIEAKTAGEKVPKGMGYDSEGNETTDPEEIMSGALKAFGGHKGSGLAFVVQALAGPLIKADYFNSDSDNAGNLVMAIDPELFVPPEELEKEISGMVKRVKSSKRADGFEEIFVPGERGNKYQSESLEEGEIEIEGNLLESLKEVASKKT